MRPTRRFASTSRIRRESACDVEFVTPIRQESHGPRLFSEMARVVLSHRISPIGFARAIAAAHVETARKFRWHLSICRAGTTRANAQYILLTAITGCTFATPRDCFRWSGMSDLGSIRLVDRKGEKQGAWQRIAEKIAGKTQRYSLQIDRLDLSRFSRFHRPSG